MYNRIMQTATQTQITDYSVTYDTARGWHVIDTQARVVSRAADRDSARMLVKLRRGEI